MPDITMCSSKNCPMRGSCYRSRAKPDKLQSWTNFEYFCNENSGFDEYIKIYQNKTKINQEYWLYLDLSYAKNTKKVDFL